MPGDFDTVFAIAWFAHVPRVRHEESLDGIHGRVFLVDEMFCLGPSRIDVETGDTYGTRSLVGDETYEIVDNKYMEAELAGLFGPYGHELEIHVGEHYWWITYKVA